jgi:hypothetical protein
MHNAGASLLARTGRFEHFESIGDTLPHFIKEEVKDVVAKISTLTVDQ